MYDKMKTTNCLNMQYMILKDLFFDNKIENRYYILCTSNAIDNYYWNTAYLKIKANENILLEIENYFKVKNKKGSIYLGKNDKYYKENKEFLLDNNYILENEDIYMYLENVKTYKLDLNIKIVENENEYNDFMEVLASAHNDIIENPDENIYANTINENYYNIIKNTMSSQKHMNIIAYDGKIPVSVGTFSYINKIGEISNVGTKQGHWNKGYGTQLITFIINKFQDLKGKCLILNTEYKSKNQHFYEKLGFKEMYIMEQYTKN